MLPLGSPIMTLGVVPVAPEKLEVGAWTHKGTSEGVVTSAVYRHFMQLQWPSPAMLWLNDTRCRL